jgi:beta-lactamase regulating signal transducer with metallopeptidase domain
MTEQINKIAEIWWSWMWPMFWQAGVLIVLIATVDLFIKRWVWPQVRYALWFLVLVKLVLSPDLTSPASLTSQIPVLAKKAVQSQITLPEKSSQNTTNTILSTTPTEPFKTRPYKDSPDTTQATVARVVTTEAVDPKPTKITPVPMTLSWRVYGFMVWLLGVAFLSSGLILRLRRLRKESLNDSGEVLPEWFENLRDQIAQRLKLRRPPEIVLSGKVCSPATFGVFRPVLLMPKDKVANLSKTKAEHILLHELAHIKRGDLFVHGFYMLLLIVYWFNPLLWLIRTHLQNLRELCCDATVAMILKEKTFSYRETLLETAKQLLTKQVDPGLGLLGLFENSKRLADRLKWLEKKTWKNRPRQLATIIALVGVMLGCVLPMAKATKGEAAVAPGGIEFVEGTAKAVATNPQPRDGATTGTIVSTLKWKPGVNAISHKIYFGTQTDQLPLLAEVKNPSYDELPELEEGTRYYWLVNEVWADGTVIAGDVWSFTTGKLVGWWKFDETEGRNAGDSSTNNNVGTLVGNPQWQPSAGKVGGALVFDGFDDYVDCGNDPSLDITKKITVAAWVKMNDAGNSQFQPYITKGDYTYGLKHHSRNVIEFDIYDDGFWQVAHFPVDSSFNDVWHHVAGTYDGNKLKLYVDGKLEVATAYAGSIASGTYNLNIGSNSEARGRFYNGAIDDVRVYNYALSEKEIEKLCRLKSIKPHPSNDTTKGLTEVPELSWIPAIGAITNRVYGGVEPDELKLLGETKESHFSKLPDMHTNMVYYWRVDGILADGSIAKGDVWSFLIPPRNAYNPFPADGVEFVEQNVELRWEAGFGAKMHTVYIGKNFDDVSNVSGGLPQTQDVYVANNLELGKTYFWRVDEFDAVDTYKGTVWSFETLPEISVSDPNLVGWWKFDGNAKDSSGNGNNGAKTGDPMYVAGKIGHAISFDGVNDRIEVNATFAGNPELFPAKAISVSAWVRTTVPRNALCSLIRHEFHFTPLQTFADSAWAIAFVNRYGSMARHRSNLDWSKINDGKWHYYAVTYNNGIHEVWIDGTKEVSNYFGPFTLWTGDDQPWVFGGKERGEGSGEYYPGELDDVRIYNYALSKGEITTLYNEGK